MQRFLLIALGALVLASAGTGCTAIPTDMFPKFTWAWSKEARDYRASKNQAEKNYEYSTNELVNPK